MRASRTHSAHSKSRFWRSLGPKAARVEQCWPWACGCLVHGQSGRARGATIAEAWQHLQVDASCDRGKALAVLLGAAVEC